jgi:hypothetical protein
VAANSAVVYTPFSLLLILSLFCYWYILWFITNYECDQNKKLLSRSKTWKKALGTIMS